MKFKTVLRFKANTGWFSIYASFLLSFFLFCFIVLILTRSARDFLHAPSATNIAQFHKLFKCLLLNLHREVVFFFFFLIRYSMSISQWCPGMGIENVNLLSQSSHWSSVIMLCITARSLRHLPNVF